MVFRKNITGFLLICSITLFGCNKKITGNLEDETNDPNNTYVSFGSFFELETAFDSHLISENDLMNICYYNNCRKLYDDEWQEIEPEGEIQTFDSLSSVLKKYIISDYVDSIKSNTKYTNVDFSNDNVVDIAIYCGVYNGYHALRFYDILSLPAVDTMKKIGPYNFIYPYMNGEEVILWKSIDR